MIPGIVASALVPDVAGLSDLALLDTASSTSKTATIVSPTVTPASDCLLVAFVSRSSSGGTFSISTTLANVGSWTEITLVVGVVRMSIFYAVVTGSPGSGTITITATTNLSADWRLTVCETTGHDTTAPVPQNNTGGGTATTLSILLPAAPAAGSMTVGFVTDINGTDVTPGAGFAELQDVIVGGNRTEIEYDNTSPGDTIDWSTLNTTNNAGIAIEVAAA